MQAARGASLSDPSVAGAAKDDVTPRRARLWAVFAGVAGSLYALDQVTKALVVAHLADEPDKRVIGDLLVLHLTRNPGAAFSTGTRYTVALSILAVLAVAVIVALMRRVGNGIWALALGLLLAGVGGNLTDRLVRDPGPFRGHVVDFLMLPHWPVFNVADICINLAAACILIQAFRGIRLNGTHVPARGPKAPAEPLAEPAADPTVARDDRG